MISEDNYLIYCVLFPTHASFEPEFLPSVVQRAPGALWLVYNALTRVGVLSRVMAAESN